MFLKSTIAASLLLATHAEVGTPHGVRWVNFREAGDESTDLLFAIDGNLPAATTRNNIRDERRLRAIYTGAIRNFRGYDESADRRLRAGLHSAGAIRNFRGTDRK
jgi:hypothetical protein